MNGMDTIIRRLNDDAQAELEAVLEKARQAASEITARYEAAAARETEELTARNQRAAAEREERLVSAAQMEGRKKVLAAKQTVMDAVYDRALEKLRGLPQERYVAVLAELLTQAAPQGRGTVIFSAEDRERVGPAAVEAANGKTGGTLAVAEETAKIPGGFILKDGSVEVNCAFDTLIRLQKAETAGQVARQLFG